MKVLLLALLILPPNLSTASAEAYKYQCVPFQNNENAFLEGGYAQLSLSGDELRFQQFDQPSETRPPVLLREYVFENRGIAGGRGKVKDMLRFRLAKIEKRYGDNIDELFLDEAMQDGGYELRIGGKGGRLTFTGQGYKYDWNICHRL